MKSSQQSDKVTYVLRVPQEIGERVINWLCTHQQIHNFYKITRHQHDLFIPLTEAIEIPPEFVSLEVKLFSIKDLPVPLSPRTKKHIPILKDALKPYIPPFLHPFIPHSFDVIGSIAILELNRQEQEPLRPYIPIIGKKMLELHPNYSAVYEKAGDISGEYRTRSFNFICGRNSTQTIHKENNCAFELDINKTFFTPRLSTERQFIASLDTPFNFRGYVLDLFCGVGPFLIQIAKNHPTGHFIGIDINPQAIWYAQNNIQLNQISSDIRFFHQDVAQMISNPTMNFLRKQVSRIIMNLPEKSLAYLHYLPEFLSPAGCLIHTYQFTPRKNSHHEAEDAFHQVINQIPVTLTSIERVRIVKPFSPVYNTTCIDAIIHPNA